MILPDVNVLIYAFRKDSAQHPVCKRWLDDVVSGEARYGLSPLALSAVIRITTNPRAYRQPSTTAEAFAYANNLLGQPNCEAIVPGDRHWEIFDRMVMETNTRGSRVTDAWYAALAIESGCTWITYDRDFARFPGLSWREPS
jgi:uncharacterized protein